MKRSQPPNNDFSFMRCYLGTLNLDGPQTLRLVRELLYIRLTKGVEESQVFKTDSFPLRSFSTMVISLRGIIGSISPSRISYITFNIQDFAFQIRRPRKIRSRRNQVDNEAVNHQLKVNTSMLIDKFVMPVIFFICCFDIMFYSITINL